MRFITSLPLLTSSLSFATSVYAQSSNINTQLISAPAPATTTYAPTPQQICLSSCRATDVDCRAACIGAAHPNQSQISLANECAMKCVQGDGSVLQTNAYNQCLISCQSGLYPATATATAIVMVTPTVNSGVTVSGVTKASVTAVASGSGVVSASGSGIMTGNGGLVTAVSSSGSVKPSNASATALGTAAAATLSKAAGARATAGVFASVGAGIGGLMGMAIAALAL